MSEPGAEALFTNIIVSIGGSYSLLEVPNARFLMKGTVSATGKLYKEGFTVGRLQLLYDIHQPEDMAPHRESLGDDEAPPQADMAWVQDRSEREMTENGHGENASGVVMGAPFFTFSPGEIQRHDFDSFLARNFSSVLSNVLGKYTLFTRRRSEFP